MNDRQKLATLLFRLAGAALIARVLTGLALLTYAPGVSLVARQYPPQILMRSSLTWLALGLVLVLASVPLGKLFGRGLD